MALIIKHIDDLILERYGDGYERYKCPKCKRTIFEGYSGGITMHNVEECSCGRKLGIRMVEEDED